MYSVSSLQSLRTISAFGNRVAKTKPQTPNKPYLITRKENSIWR